MDFRFTEKEEALRREVRQFCETHADLMEAVRVETESGVGHGPKTHEMMHLLGQRGWLTPSWPKEHGGLGASYMERYIINNELVYSGAPKSQVGVNIAGPTIMLYGSDDQKKTFLPRIATGEIEFALGYTEPDAGSDLSAIEIRAAKNGDEYIIDGTKVFNSACHYAQFHWLGVRTGTTESKHRGISLFIVDMNAPGVTIRPLIGMDGMRTNEVHYENVKVPATRRVGEENKGFYYIATALSFERNWLIGRTQYWLNALVEYLKNTKHNGKTLADDPVMRQKLGEIAAEAEVSRLFGIRIAYMINKGKVPDYEAAMGKAFGSETEHRLAVLWMNVLGQYSRTEAGPEHARLYERVHSFYFEAIRGLITRGTSEIMRNVIATRGLGLPRA